jgi:hypothetical protein
MPTTMCASNIPRCGGLARPNILMFNDWTLILDRRICRKSFTKIGQRMRLNRLLSRLARAPTPLRYAETRGSIAAPIIRMNSGDAEAIGNESNGMKMGALNALWQVAKEMRLAALPRAKGV